MKFTKREIGTWASANNNIRIVLSGLIYSLNRELSNKLMHPASDDVDEKEALRVLNDNTAEGLIWVIENGDLVLREEKENE